MGGPLQISVAIVIMKLVGNGKDSRMKSGGSEWNQVRTGPSLGLDSLRYLSSNAAPVVQCSTCRPMQHLSSNVRQSLTGRQKGQLNTANRRFYAICQKKFKGPLGKKSYNDKSENNVILLACHRGTDQNRQIVPPSDITKSC